MIDSHAEPLWFTAEDIRAIHDHVLDADNLQGESLDKSIEATIDRVQNQVQYGQIPNQVIPIAVAYCIAILRGHCFIDGNKRTGLIALDTYLNMHQIRIDMDQDYIADVMIKGASGDLSERMLFDVIVGHLVMLE